MKKNAVKILGCHIGLIVFLSAFSNTSSSAAPDPSGSLHEGRIRQIERKLSQEKGKLEAFNSKERNLLDELSGLEKEVEEKNQAIKELEKNIRRVKQKGKALQEQLATVEKRHRDAEGRMAERLVALYKYARTGYMRALATAKDLNQFRGRMKYAWSVMKQDQEMLVRLTREERDYRRRVRGLKEKIAQTDTAKGVERRRLLKLRKDLEEKVILLMHVHKEKEFYETAVAQLELAAKDLRRALNRIEDKKPEKLMRSAHFTDFKGRLPLPTSGKIMRGGQFLKASRQNFQKGVFFDCRQDAEVKAVFPGRVDFSGRLKGYGEIIVINHGSRFFTISALLTQRYSQKGDAVEAGEIIGRIEKRGSSAAPGLYFEIRKAGDNLDPLVWLKRP
jgi:septal ring factor EnvC (AmiA/AmiB activator)